MEITSNAVQEVATGANVLMTDTVIPGGCSIVHRSGSGKAAMGYRRFMIMRQNGAGKVVPLILLRIIIQRLNSQCTVWNVWQGRKIRTGSCLRCGS